MQTSIWYRGNDMTAEMTGVRSSTMGSTQYLNSSTGMRVTVWDGLSTGSTSYLVVSNRLMSYVAGSNGGYRAVIQSTESTRLTLMERGLIVYKLNHSGLNAEWRVNLRVESRGTT